MYASTSTTKSHHYDVMLGHRFLAEAVKSFDDKLQKADKLIVFTDVNVWAAQGDYFKANFPYDFEVFVLPGGEACKTFENIMQHKLFYLNKNAHVNHSFLHLVAVQLGI